MAHAEREVFPGLKIDTVFARRQSPSPVRKYGGNDRSDDQTEEGNIGQVQDEENSVMDELHTDTPPMAVPRPDEHHFSSLEPEISYSHKPEEDYSSFEDFLRDRQQSINHISMAKVDQGHNDVRDEPLAGLDTRHTGYHKPLSRQSILRNMQIQDERVPESSGLKSKQEGGIERQLPISNGIPYRSKRDDGQSPNIELDRPTSLTSVSTMSPLEEVRTPSEFPKEEMKDVLLSPLSSSPIVQRAASLDDPNLWSVGGGASYGNKARSYTVSRHNSWRQAMRQGSRRSTGSSGKSPASAFLSMWSSPEEIVAPSRPDDEGQMVGTDYVIGKKIGYGGFSTVKEAFKVEKNGSTRRLAVKIVKKHVSGRSEQENDQVQAEFDHEVRIWRQLNYHHILSLEAVYETDYATFCFTKLAIGGTLFDLVKANRSGLDMSLARRYSHELASAIRYLHEDMRVVHRDIKLENCLLDPVMAEDGTETAKLVLCDFGMAEWMTTDSGGEPLDTYDNPADRPPPQNIGPSGSSTSVAGSLEYASPELLLSSTGLVDPAVDIWAFGVVVYATVVGSRPFQDTFGPRVHANIIKGEWDHNAVLKGHEHDKHRREALDLIRNCLEMDTNTRWTVRQALDCMWFRNCAHVSDEPPNESTWRF